MEDFALAQGYSWSEESVQRESQAQMTELLWAVLLSIVLIMLLMAILFESVIQPLAILVTVPLAIWGALWALVLVLGKIDPMAVIGLLLLGGVVVNNGIVLLDHIVRLRNQGWGREDAIREGVAVRMRPVFMTASTTFVGLMPMVLFGERDEGLSYVGLSVAVAFGLAFSTVFTAVAVPIAYSLADDYVLLLRASFQRALGRAAS
jgi:HAE1 family hydrophobic/amphiphilic exporter-1